ncbi:winged helix-turn-helix domain-containing protein [Methanolobus sediminis]|uniref:Winged helix-turn-helix domain-containing protein n=1 Tax=Methanolobus sediminis TaxID=3072978 RepID=A0AA51ULA9_9EURY|nr:winged helix-turn-helix domain-containing protein [Methanolobus sediminis]WMW25188.1 winged helix-turn-helix domain-containing protein [Methanolobus sediminis]
MKKRLLDVVFASDKRKNVLLLLQNGPQEMDYLLKSLETTRNAILPQIKILEEHCLVFHYNDIYKLTTIGKLIVDEMKPLIDTIEVLDIDIDYWGSRNLDFIPSYLLERISELSHCNIIIPSLENIFEVNHDFLKKSEQSTSLFFVFTFIHPSFPPYISQFCKNDTNASIIVSKNLLQKIKEEWRVEANNHISSGKIKFYLYQSDLKMASLSVSDSCFVIRLLSKNNEYDHTQVFGCKSQAQQWGKALFDYCLEDSIPITEI